MITFEQGSVIDLTLNIRGNAVDISFTFLGTKKVVDNVDYFEFVSVTSNPFSQKLSIEMIHAMLPAPSVEASFSLDSVSAV